MQKLPKKPLGYRVGQRLRSAGSFGRDAVRSPRSIPRHAYGWLRHWFRKVWNVRGGGLYAVGYALAFLYFEAKTIIGEIADASGVRDYVSSQIAEFIVRFTADTISNMVHAFIWPVYVIQVHPVYGGIALGLAFWLFPKYLKPPIERWLFSDAPPEEETQ
ncbi:MAG: hypothetical protein R3288_08500 [Woeseiaceae bacterium]|nr:hypothetical protein [Woeseiaceae bacterium]